MRCIVTGGTGLIGRNLIKLWLQKKYTITVIGRSQQHIVDMFGSTVKAVTWDRVTSALLQEADVIVHLAGASVVEKPWTMVRKEQLISSRIDTTKIIVSCLLELNPQSAPRLFSASAITVYASQALLKQGLPERITEQVSSVTQPTSFIMNVSQGVEKTISPAIEKGFAVVFLRFGVVLAKERGAFPNMIKPFHLMMGGPIGSGKQACSWITIDDAISAIDFLSSKNINGPFNITSPHCVTQKQFASDIGKVLHRPSFFRTPAFLLKLMLGEMAQLMLESRNVYPERLLDLGFQFRYPDPDLAVRHLLEK
jgi:uncharacterized protein (TIGR01777 family)